MNPYMTARMFVKFVQIDRAILIPKDFKGNTIIIIDAKDSAGRFGKGQENKGGSEVRSLRAIFRRGSSPDGTSDKRQESLSDRAELNLGIYCQSREPS